MYFNFNFRTDIQEAAKNEVPIGKNHEADKGQWKKHKWKMSWLIGEDQKKTIPTVLMLLCKMYMMCI